MTEEQYMNIAIKLAQNAATKDEVPVGAIIVDKKSGEIIAEAYNQSAHDGDATSHAEILAIQRACTKLQTTRLWNTDMYVTLEPCTMCAAAISFARIHTLYFGAIDEKGGAIINGVKFYEAPTCHHKPHVKAGICENTCASLLKDFFKQKRNKD